MVHLRPLHLTAGLAVHLFRIDQCLISEENIPSASMLYPSYDQMPDAHTTITYDLFPEAYTSLDLYSFGFDDTLQSPSVACGQRSPDCVPGRGIPSSLMAAVSTRRRRSEKFPNILAMDDVLSRLPNAQIMRDAISPRLTKRPFMLHPLTWLAVEFASPSTLRDLFCFFRATQSGAIFAPPTQHTSVPELMSGIERLESDILTASTVRRLYLARLYQQFDARLRQYRVELPGKSRVGNGAATAVLDNMAHELPLAVVTDGDSEDRRKRLKNRLTAAKPWYHLSMTFTESSLALMPKGLSNSMYDI